MLHRLRYNFLTREDESSNIHENIKNVVVVLLCPAGDIVGPEPSTTPTLLLFPWGALFRFLCTKPEVEKYSAFGGIWRPPRWESDCSQKFSGNSLQSHNFFCSLSFFRTPFSIGFKLLFWRLFLPPPPCDTPLLLLLLLWISRGEFRSTNDGTTRRDRIGEGKSKTLFGGIA